MDLGFPEILALVVIALLLFGPSKLPALGRSMGEAIRGFKKGLSGADESEQKPRASVDTQIPYNQQQSGNYQTQQQTEKTNKT